MSMLEKDKKRAMRRSAEAKALELKQFRQRIKTKPHKSLDYLDTPEAMEAYLEEMGELLYEEAESIQLPTTPSETTTNTFNETPDSHDGYSGGGASSSYDGGSDTPGSDT